MQATRGTPLNGPDPGDPDRAPDPTPAAEPAPGPADPVAADPVAADPVPADRGARRRRTAALLGVALGVWVADLVTKTLAVTLLPDQPPVQLLGGLLTLRLIRNSGAAFGLATGYTVVLSLLAIGVVVVVVRLARRLASTGWAVALGLLLGGAAGNLTDRIFRDPAPLRGHVVDFLQLPHWPIFNVADSSITVAAVLIVVLSLLGRRLDGADPPGPKR